MEKTGVIPTDEMVWRLLSVLLFIFGLSSGPLLFVSSHSVAIDDYDNDRFIDILYVTPTNTISGLSIFNSSSTSAYANPDLVHNNQGNNFTEAVEVQLDALGLPILSFGYAAWGDYDNDGRSDVLLTGLSPQGDWLTRIYVRNQNDEAGGGILFAEADVRLPGIFAGRGIWADLDNDGDLDIILSGVEDQDDDPKGVIRLFENHNDNAKPVSPVSNVSAEYDPVAETLLITWNPPLQALGYTYNVQVEDLTTGEIYGGGLVQPGTDGRGRLVVGMGNAGCNTAAEVTNLRSSNGTGFLVRVQSINAAFQASAWTSAKVLILGGWSAGLPMASVDLNDYDHNGFLDVLYTTTTNLASASEPTLVENNGTVLRDRHLDRGMPDLQFSWVAWGDHNGDGHADVLLTGMTIDETWVSKVFESLGDGSSFAEASDVKLPGLVGGRGMWADIDNDGDLDIVLSGLIMPDEGSLGNIQTEVRVFKNQRHDNLPAVSPVSNVRATYDRTNGTLLVLWDAPVGAVGYTYNVEVQDLATGAYVVGSLVRQGSSGGDRLVAGLGNAGCNTAYAWKGPSTLGFGIKVQSINAAFQASTWTSIQLSTLPSPSPSPSSSPSRVIPSASSSPSVSPSRAPSPSVTGSRTPSPVPPSQSSTPSPSSSPSTTPSTSPSPTPTVSPLFGCGTGIRYVLFSNYWFLRKFNLLMHTAAYCQAALSVPRRQAIAIRYTESSQS